MLKTVGDWWRMVDQYCVLLRVFLGTKGRLLFNYHDTVRKNIPGLANCIAMYVAYLHTMKLQE